MSAADRLSIVHGVPVVGLLAIGAALLLGGVALQSGGWGTPRPVDRGGAAAPYRARSAAAALAPTATESPARQPSAQAPDPGEPDAATPRATTAAPNLAARYAGWTRAELRQQVRTLGFELNAAVLAAAEPLFDEGRVRYLEAERAEHPTVLRDGILRAYRSEPGTTTCQVAELDPRAHAAVYELQDELEYVKALVRQRN